MLSYALKEIKRPKLRTAGNIAGSVITGAFLIITVSITQAYTVVANWTLQVIGTHFVAYIPASRNCPKSH